MRRLNVQPQMEMKEAAEEYLKAAEPYGAALQDLREYLLAAEPFDRIAVELDHTERFIKALNKEKKVASKLITRSYQHKHEAGRLTRLSCLCDFGRNKAGR